MAGSRYYLATLLTPLIVELFSGQRHKRNCAAHPHASAFHLTARSCAAPAAQLHVASYGAIDPTVAPTLPLLPRCWSWLLPITPFPFNLQSPPTTATFAAVYEFLPLACIATPKIFVLVQCTPDLAPSECRSCLAYVLAARMKCSGAQRCIVGLLRCGYFYSEPLSSPAHRWFSCCHLVVTIKVRIACVCWFCMHLA
jgi:hypothetical protein